MCVVGEPQAITAVKFTARLGDTTQSNGTCIQTIQLLGAHGRPGIVGSCSWGSIPIPEKRSFLAVKNACSWRGISVDCGAVEHIAHIDITPSCGLHGRTVDIWRLGSLDANGEPIVKLQSPFSGHSEIVYCRAGPLLKLQQDDLELHCFDSLNAGLLFFCFELDLATESLARKSRFSPEDAFSGFSSKGDERTLSCSHVTDVTFVTSRSRMEATKVKCQYYWKGSSRLCGAWAGDGDDFSTRNPGRLRSIR
ncbi:hypothetical protein BD410DRAFT_5256 [Rickenella mellea]|uniref:Uncharacterized protein n=1 Tax=Rickenella mellea TaxID=50990 RepID=A0A4R5XEG4_9AGAM|nr:hypothetical protein BD410DRAFT_5256 [Rickenella mellea]